MSQKGSILSSVVAQVVALLRADPTLAARLINDAGDVQVYNNVPVGTPPPYLWVLSGSEYDPKSKLGVANYARGCTVKVCPVSRHRGTKEIDELGSLAMEVIGHQPLTIPDFKEAGIVWDGDTRDPIVMEVEGAMQFTREIVFRASAR